MVFIYVLRLKQGKYYVGVSDDVDKRFAQHQQGQGSIWTKTYPPLSIMQVVEKKGPFDEDNKTKELMMMHGIDNVRGGTYSMMTLGPSVVKHLEAEFCHAENRCFSCNEQGHYSSQCPSKLQPLAPVKLNQQRTTGQQPSCF